MTDTIKRPTEWHTTAEGPDSEITELRRALAAAELRAITAAQREDTAQFAFETAKRRADRAESALRVLLVDRISPELPEVLEGSAEGITDCLIDDIAAGATVEELDVSGHVESWLEGKQ